MCTHLENVIICTLTLFCRITIECLILRCNNWLTSSLDCYQDDAVSWSTHTERNVICNPPCQMSSSEYCKSMTAYITGAKYANHIGTSSGQAVKSWGKRKAWKETTMNNWKMYFQNTSFKVSASQALKVLLDWTDRNSKCCANKSLSGADPGFS